MTTTATVGPMLKSKASKKTEPVTEVSEVKELITDIISDEVKTEELVKAEEPKPAEKLNLRSEMKKLIETGKYSQREILDLLHNQFPTILKSTISTILSDSRNARYAKFEFLTKVTEDGKYIFTDQKSPLFKGK